MFDPGFCGVYALFDANSNITLLRFFVNVFTQSLFLGYVNIKNVIFFLYDCHAVAPLLLCYKLYH